jgi:ectoine hydroxylase-related dioxygenase (phytanoyl-CoA dioxygenase family)
MVSSAAPANAVDSMRECVRPVTDSEVAFFEQNGWVLLRGLITPEQCNAMLDRGKPRMAGLLGGDQGVSAFDSSTRERMTVAGARGEGTVTDIKQWVEWRGSVRDARDPAFCAVSLDKQMGCNVRRLLGRDRPLRVYHDILTCKLPDEVSIPTSYHQDGPNFPLDRNALTVWIALCEITPDMGPVQSIRARTSVACWAAFRSIRSSIWSMNIPNWPALRCRRRTTCSPVTPPYTTA